MTVFWILLVCVLLLILCYGLLLRGCPNAPGLEKLQGWAYAHRGLHHKPSIPENSLAAFRLAVERGYGAELDVHLLKDGGLAVIHDSALKRTTGAQGLVEDLCTAQLRDYRLEESSEPIPTFQEVLALFEGKAPLIIELKTYGNNAPALCEAVCRQLGGYAGDFCLESFDPQVLRWLRKNRPELIRGQLSMNFCKQHSGMGALGDFALTNLLSNFLTRPHFIAYEFGERNILSNRICLDLWSLQGVSWTIRKQEDFDACRAEGLLPIFEQFEPEGYEKPQC